MGCRQKEWNNIKVFIYKLKGIGPNKNKNILYGISKCTDYKL